MALNKSQAMALIKKGRLTEIFEHATMGRFNVSLIREFVLAEAREGAKLYRCRFDQISTEDEHANPVEWLAENREVDSERVAEFTAAQLTDPVIFVDCPPGLNGEGKTQLLIDGVHRLMGRYQRGYEDFSFWLVPHDIAVALSQGLEGGINIPWGSKEVRDGKLVDREV